MPDTEDQINQIIECDDCGNDDEFLVFVSHAVKRRQQEGEVDTEVMASDVDLVRCSDCGWVLYMKDLDEEDTEDAQNIEEGSDES